jgi:Uma2 family endonuclease
LSVRDDAWLVVPGPGVVLDRRNYREPDLVVVRREALNRRCIDAADLLLAVEVMNSSSITDDRLTKPAQPARIGIPHCWRLERGDVLVTHELEGEGEVCREAARFTNGVVLEYRWPSGAGWRTCSSDQCPRRRQGGAAGEW